MKTRVIARKDSKIEDLRATSMPAGTKKEVYLRLVNRGEISKKNQLPANKVDAFFGVVSK